MIMKKYLKFIFLFVIAVIAIPIFAQDVPPADPEPGLNIWTIISGVLAVLGTVFATAFVKIKKKIGQFVTLARKTVDLLETVTTAIGDNTVTKEEIAEIREDIAEVKTAWKALWNKT